MSKFEKTEVPTFEKVPYLKGVFRITHDDGSIQYGEIAPDEELIIYSIDLILENQNDPEFIYNFAAIFIDIIDSTPQLKTSPNLINTRNSSDINLLTCTIFMNCIESTKYLLDHFSNLQFTYKSEGKEKNTNPLILAIGNNKKLEIIQLLIDYMIKYNIEENFLNEKPIIGIFFKLWINNQFIDYDSIVLIDKIIDTIISVSSIGHIISEDICEEYLVTISKSPFHVELIDNILQRILTYVEILITNIETLSSSEDITLETLFEEDNLFIVFFHSKIFKLTVTSSKIAKELYTKLNLTFCFNSTCSEIPKFYCSCMNVKYCGKKCQKSHRKFHKEYCYPVLLEKAPIDTSIQVENSKSFKIK